MRSLTPDAQAVLRFFKGAYRPVLVTEIYKATGLDPLNGRHTLEDLVGEGILERFKTIASPHPHYMLTPHGELVKESMT